MVDSKFAEQPVSDGIFSVINIFPDDALNTIIAQMRRNSTALVLLLLKWMYHIQARAIFGLNYFNPVLSDR